MHTLGTCSKIFSRGMICGVVEIGDGGFIVGMGSYSAGSYYGVVFGWAYEGGGVRVHSDVASLGEPYISVCLKSM